MSDPTWLAIVPPVVAIAAAIITRQVFLSLFLGVWMGWTALEGGNPLKGMVEALAAIVRVFESGYNTKVILFSALVGSLITLTQRTGGVDGFVQFMRQRRIGGTPRSVGLLGTATGIVVFVESSVTCLVVGSVIRPLGDRLRMAREKIAYICDTTSAPVCILIPLNAWGAYVMGLLAEQNVDRPLAVMARAIPLNFYAWFALAVMVAIILTGKDFGPMAKAEERARKTGMLLRDGAVPMVADDVIAIEPKEGVKPRARNMVLPLAVLVLMMPLGLYVTGVQAIASGADAAAAAIEQLDARDAELGVLIAETDALLTAESDATAVRALRADLAAEHDALAAEREKLVARHAMDRSLFNILNEGSGATAVFWAVLAAIFAAAVMAMAQRFLNFAEVMQLSIKGAGGLIPMAIIMILAFAINDTCSALGTGIWVAEATRPFLDGAYVPVVLFVVSCVIAFSTGTSWGTFGIMMPIGIPLAVATGGSLPLVLAAILGGGVFGDHCSPISDTSVISSMASACDHIDHVRTQLPYALTAAAGAVVVYLIMGFMA